MSQDPGATQPATIESDQAEVEGTGCSKLQKVLSNIAQKRPKPREELDDIGAKLLDGKAFADSKEKENIEKAFKPLEITETIQQDLGQYYASKVYTYRCKKDSKNYLLLWGNRSTFGSFMPTVALEDARDVFSETVRKEIMVPFQEGVKVKTQKQVSEAYATMFSKTYSIARSFVLCYIQTEDPSLAAQLFEQFNALSGKDTRESWSDFHHVGSVENLYSEKVVENAKKPKESLKDSAARREARIAELEAINSSLGRQNDLYLEVICERALGQMWLKHPGVRECAKYVVLSICSLVGDGEKVLPLLKSPDPTRELVFLPNSGEAIKPKTLLEFMALCLDLESDQVEALVHEEWLQLNNGSSIPCIDVQVAFKVYLMVAEVPFKDKVCDKEVTSFVKFLGARLRAFDSD